MNTPASKFYNQEFEFYSKKIELLTKKIKLFSRIRVFCFVIGVLAIYFVSTTNMYWVSLFLFVFVFLFVIIAVFHGRLIEKKHQAAVYLQMYINEIGALEGNFYSFSTGDKFADLQHPFATDLDLFGKESVFQMLNRCFSERGEEFLAYKLKTLEKNAVSIIQRQEAVKELAETPKWTFDFRALGELAFNKESDFASNPNTLTEDLYIWINRPSIFENRSFKIAQILIPLFSLIVFGLYLSNVMGLSLFLLYLLSTLSFTGFFMKHIKRQHQEITKQSSLLFRFQTLIEHIENGKFESEGLKDIQREFFYNTFKASYAVKKLGHITQAFDTRLNVFVWPILNYFFLWDIRQSIRLEEWKSKFKNLPTKAFAAIAEMEMISSLAVFYFNRTDLIFPVIEKNEFVIDGKAVGHPLMNPKNRIDNDIIFHSRGRFNVITGANMAGKSTYLRTVGVNLVLALIGAPVCANKFKTSILQPFTSIKTSDSLSNNESYFYAELLRLQQIINALKTDQTYFIILDEILKGTNSKDKEQGSKALVSQLIGLNAVGIIATHDLQLAELSKSFPKNITTACFEVEIENDQLVFDYKLRDGVSQNLNATFLMEKMGISVPSMKYL